MSGKRILCEDCTSQYKLLVCNTLLNRYVKKGEKNVLSIRISYWKILLKKEKDEGKELQTPQDISYSC